MNDTNQVAARCRAFLAEANQRIGSLPVGNEFTLVELFGNDWEEQTATTGGQVLGRWFSEALQRGEGPNVEQCGIHRVSRANLYRKL